MGQRLEKLSEKDGESLDNSDWSEQTGDTQLSETAEQDESKHQEDGGFAIHQIISGIKGISGSSLATRHTGELTVSSARTDPQTGQPIRPLGQSEHPLNTSGGGVGGVRKSATRTVEESKTVWSLKETRQTSNERKGSENRPVVWTGTTAMEEQGNQNTSETNQLDPESQTRDLTSSLSPTNEEDFVVLEKDETWTSSDADKNILTGSRKKGFESDPSHACRNDTLPQPSRNVPQEGGHEKHDTVAACARSPPTVCFEREMGRHLAEVTGSRCQLKGVSHVGTAYCETTAKGIAEREQNLPSNMKQKPLPTQDQSKNEGKENHGSEFIAPQPQLMECHQNKFAGAVSKRVKSGGTGCLLSSTKKDDSQAFDKVANSHPPQAMTPPSEISQLQDNLTFRLEQCDSMPCPPLTGDEGCDGKIQVASSKTEGELVSSSPATTPPPVSHLLPKKGATMSNPVNLPTVPEATSDSTNPNNELMLTGKPKVKGPPPPVPKKPKNPFIKLKTAQLMSTDVQRRGKDHLRSEERVKRRHTYHFNKDLPWRTPTNQDMCLLWDERGTYTIPANIRRLSADLSPWEQLSLGHMDDRYGDMVDYDYCLRMAGLSQEEEIQNLDMLQRRVSLENLPRVRRSPPPVIKKLLTPLASTETLNALEDRLDNETQSPKSTFSRKKEIYPELLSERARTWLRSDSHSDPKDLADHANWRDAEKGSEVGSYKPVALIIKETNQMHKQHSQIRTEGAKTQVSVAEQGSSVKVSQMKNAFDVPKKSKVRSAEVQAPPKKGECQISACLLYQANAF